MGYIIAGIVGGLILITLLSGLLIDNRINPKNKVSDEPSDRELDAVRINYRTSHYRFRSKR